MLLSGLVMFFNTSLVEIFTKLTDYTWGGYLWGRCGDGLGELWRGAKGFIASAGLTADPFLLYTLCTIALFPLAKPGVIAQLSHLAARMLIFCRTEYLGRIWRPGGSDGSLAGSAGERDHHAHPTVYAVFFRSFITGLARFLRQTDVKPFRLSRCVCRGCGRDVFRHWSSIWGGLRKHTTVVSQPRAGE